MKNSKILHWIFKAYYFIKGCIKLLFKIKKNTLYHGGINNYTCQYIGKRTFYETQQASGLGFITWDQRKRTYPIWQIGFFNFK